ncbi:hypothetical protein EMPS_05315 [Entomortierella parvispora]|uniref:Uncharacterized protein n=1 Tax=Entomortierella parvispora TaxID=205924 RepID=A0A9P3HA88_9FUNG|nr:hypothetical protein EMPS_05315 [Entomortierella parvispora]
MLANNQAARLFSVSNAAKLLRSSLPNRTFASAASSFSANPRNFFFSNSNRTAFNSCAPASNSFSTPSRFFSSSTARPVFGANSTTAAFAKNSSTVSSSFAKGQASRGFCRRAWHGEGEGHGHHHHHQSWFGRGRHHGEAHKGPAGPGASPAAGAAGEVERATAAAFHHWGHHHHHWKHLGRRGYHYDHHMMHRFGRRRRFRFLFKMMAISTVLVAVPAVVVLDAPLNTLFYVPLTVGGAGFVMMLTGRLLIFFLPLMAVGGAATFWMMSMPAATTVRDLKRILKREKQNEWSSSPASALSILGRDWQVQSARSDEWFRWTFPDPKLGATGEVPKDKIDVRMAVFDPNDHSERKAKTMKFLDRFQDEDQEPSRRAMKKWKQRHCHKGSDDDCAMLESLKVKRQGDHFMIQLEDDGEKIMEQKWAKKYLALGQIVDRAATEMEKAQPGLKLGDQVVLVHSMAGKDEDSFWNRWSPYGHVTLRIPFDRTWVKDLSSDE